MKVFEYHGNELYFTCKRYTLLFFNECRVVLQNCIHLKIEFIFVGYLYRILIIQAKSKRRFILNHV